MTWTYTDTTGRIIIRDGETSGEYLAEEMESEGRAKPTTPPATCHLPRWINDAGECEHTDHDAECTSCEHECPWQGNPLGAPFCSVCDDHMEATV
jgi:hypothetical protein